jgi:hypothetical protein
MRPTQDFDLESAYVAEEPKGMGWVTFAVVMLGLAGIWNFVDGILAVSGSHVYTDNADYVFSGLNTWGWIMMILGILMGLAALAILSGSEWARWFGIVIAGLNGIGNLMFVPVYPWWGLAVFAVDVLIIYGLAVYGGSRLRTAL